MIDDHRGSAPVNSAPHRKSVGVFDALVTRARAIWPDYPDDLSDGVRDALIRQEHRIVPLWLNLMTYRNDPRYGKAAMMALVFRLLSPGVLIVVSASGVIAAATLWTAFTQTRLLAEQNELIARQSVVAELDELTPLVQNAWDGLVRALSDGASTVNDIQQFPVAEWEGNETDVARDSLLAQTRRVVYALRDLIESIEMVRIALPHDEQLEAFRAPIEMVGPPVNAIGDVGRRSGSDPTSDLVLAWQSQRASINQFIVESDRFSPQRVLAAIRTGAIRAAR